MTSSKERTFEVAGRVLSAIREIVPKGEFEAPTIMAAAITLFWRGMSLYEAITLLAKEEYIEEGLVLARSLFEDSLTCHEMFVSDLDRAALVFKWTSNSISEKEALMKEAERLEFAGDKAAVFSQLADQRKDLQSFAAKHGVVRTKALLSPRDAALKFGRKSDYWTYRFAHQFVHGSDAAAVFRRRKNLAGIHEFHGRTRDQDLTAALIAFSSRSLLQMSRAVATMMKWGEMSELDNVEKMVAALEQ